MKNTDMNPNEKRRKQNRNTASAEERKSKFNYFYVPNSEVFHLRICKTLLRANSFAGCIHYSTASDGRRPCKLCRPVNIDGTVLDITYEKKPSTYSGYCHYLRHPGFMLPSTMIEHHCIEKNCRYFEKIASSKYWIHEENRRKQRELQKAQKKMRINMEAVKNEENEELRWELQDYADIEDYDMEIIQAEMRPRGLIYVFYVSNNRFADGNRFPLFLDQVKNAYPSRRVVLRHIKDVDGHFVTIDEYYSRRKK